MHYRYTVCAVLCALRPFFAAYTCFIPPRPSLLLWCVMVLHTTHRTDSNLSWFFSGMMMMMITIKRHSGIDPIPPTVIDRD